MRRLPSLNAVRVFEAAARHENFSRAADELSVTQSAISRQIHKLEAELGQPLFERSGPRLELTDIGREYRQIVEEALGVIRRGTEKLFSGPSPTVTLSTLPSIISKWLVPRLGDFERRHPEVSLHLSVSYQRIDFARSPKIDVAIRFGKGHWAGVRSDALADDYLFPVCSPELAARLSHPSDLLDQRLLAEDPVWDLWGVWFDAAGIRHGSLRLERLSDDFNVQLDAAALGHGIALTRGLLAADDLRSGRVVCPFPVYASSEVNYYFVCPSDRANERSIALLRDWLLGAAAMTIADLDTLLGRRRGGG